MGIIGKIAERLGDRRKTSMLPAAKVEQTARPVEAKQTLLSPEPTRYSLAILHGLQGKPMYLGTVPAHVVAKRRAKNKLARKTRRAQRAGA